MGMMNFRNVYKFDPEDADDQNTGGLLGLLQAAMQQRQMRSGTGYDPASNDANSYGSPQGGLLGRLAALQAEQSPYRTLGQNNVPAPAGQLDPNFRQLVRVTAPARSAIDPSDRPDGQLRPSYISFQGGDASANGPAGAGSQYPARTSQPSRESLDVYGDGSAPSSAVSAPTKMAQIAIPFPRPPPPFPPISTPIPPDWLQGAWNALRKGRGYGGGGRRASPRRNYDEEDCDERQAAEIDRCNQRYDDYVHPDYRCGRPPTCQDSSRLLT